MSSTAGAGCDAPGEEYVPSTADGEPESTSPLTPTRTPPPPPLLLLDVAHPDAAAAATSSAPRLAVNATAPVAPGLAASQPKKATSEHAAPLMAALLPLMLYDVAPVPPGEGEKKPAVPGVSARWVVAPWSTYSRCLDDSVYVAPVADPTDTNTVLAEVVKGSVLGSAMVAGVAFAEELKAK